MIQSINITFFQGDSIMYVNKNDSVQGSKSFPENDQAHIYCPQSKIKVNIYFSINQEN